MDERTTLQDIAVHCNLSTSTVSRVLNGNAGDFRIAAATTEKVLSTAKKLNYRPNRLARAIRGRKTNLLGLSMPETASGDDTTERRFAIEHRIMGVICAAIMQHPLFSKYDLVLHNRHERAVLPMSENDMQQDLIDGMIYSSPLVRHLEFLKTLSANIPTVLMGYIPELQDSTICVDVDNRKMAQLATEHLLSIGRQNILLLIPETSLFAFGIQGRIAGHREALEKAGLRINPDLSRVIRADADIVADFIRTSPTLENTDAILCLTDELAVFCMDPLRERGLRIPDDIALMGFGGIDLFSEKASRLSTVKVPFHTMAYEATEHLLSILEGKQPYTPGFYEVPTELVIRESTVKN